MMRPAVIFSIFGGFLATASIAEAQWVPNSAQLASSATLPESNEAMLLATQVEDAIDRGDFRLALRLIEQIMALPAELVSSPEGRTLYPVRTRAISLLRRLPPDGVRMFRELHDADVGARFAAASAAGDVATLRELFYTYPIASTWPEIGRELVAHLLDRGAHGEAIEVIRELTAAAEGTSAERRGQLAAALLSIGARPPAARIIADLEREAAPGTPAASRAKALREWLDSAAPGAIAEGDGLRPMLTGPAPWRTPLGAAETPLDIGELLSADGAPPLINIRPLHRPLVSEGVLLVRVAGQIFALDALSLTSLWTARELEARASAEIPESQRIIFMGGPDRPGAQTAGLPAALHDLVGFPLRHEISAAGGRVFTIEALQRSDDLITPQQRRMFGFDDGSTIYPNLLVARDVRTGAVIWQTALDTAAAPEGVAFQCAPVARDGRLYVAAQRRSGLVLLTLDAARGTLLHEMPLIGPPMEFPASGGRCFILADETTLYVFTGNGVICAVGREQQTWKWAAVYTSTISRGFAQRWWDAGMSELGDEDFVPPLLVDDLLVVRPVDCDEWFALDRFSGVERWRRALPSQTTPFGVAAGAALLAGGRIVSIDLADGITERWRSVQLDVCGVPTVHDGRVYVPTRTGLVVLDARTGKVLDDQVGHVPAPRDDPAQWLASVVATDAAVFAVTPGGITKYPDPQRTLAAAELRAADPDDAGRAALARARVHLASNQLEQALTTIEAIRPGNASIAAGRDAVLVDVLVALAGRAGSAEEQLGWLKRAAGVPGGPELTLRLGVLTGRVLEDARNLPAAVEHYAAMLTATAGATLSVPDDRDLRQSAALYAVTRLAACLQSLSPEQAATLRGRIIESGVKSRDANVLLHVRRLAASPAETARISAALLLCELPAQIAVAFAPSADSAGLSDADRREFGLQRCEAYLGVGDLAEAKRELAAWVAAYGDQPGEADSALRAARRRAEYLRRAIEKFPTAAPPPFDLEPVQQWRENDVEMLFDLDNPLAAAAEFVAVREPNANRVALLPTVGGGRTPVITELNPDNASIVPDRVIVPPNMRWRDAAVNEDLPQSQIGWPMRVYGRLAVVPADNRIFCIGLWPKRTGDKELWSYSIPDWSTDAPGFAAQSAAGPEGFYLAPRVGRIVCLEWASGQVRWQRELPGRMIQSLHVGGSLLFVLTRDQQCFALDAGSGHMAAMPASPVGPVLDLRIIGRTLILISESKIAGVDVETLETRWTDEPGKCDAVLPVLGRDWVAYRPERGTQWRVRAAADGAIVAGGGFEEPGMPTAMYADKETLYVAAMRPGREGADVVNVISAVGVADGAGRWSVPLPGPTSINATQLAAHATLIPVLVAGGAGSREAEAGGQLVFVDKRSGIVRGPQPLPKFNRRDGRCAPQLFATPTRLIVQLHGHLVGYGHAREGVAP